MVAQDSLACVVAVLSYQNKNLLEQSSRCSKYLHIGNAHVTEENVTGSCRDLSDTVFLYLNEALKFT